MAAHPWSQQCHWYTWPCCAPGQLCEAHRKRLCFTVLETESRAPAHSRGLYHCATRLPSQVWVPHDFLTSSRSSSVFHFLFYTENHRVHSWSEDPTTGGGSHGVLRLTADCCPNLMALSTVQKMPTLVDLPKHRKLFFFLLFSFHFWLLR